MNPPSVSPVHVSSYSGYRGEERPVAFDHLGRTLHIAKIMDAWCEGSRASGGSVKEYFRVHADDGHFYVLFYDCALKEWFLERNPSVRSSPSDEER